MGLAVIPAVKDDGRSVEGIVSNFSKWTRRLPRQKVKELFAKHEGSIALLVGHCGLVVVDCDSDAALAAAEERFGHTPVLVRGPRGVGGHLYYRAPVAPVRQANLRRTEGLPIDIKAGKGAYVIVPPSARPSNGALYKFERGSWDDVACVARLPVFNGASLINSTTHSASNRVEVGRRNDHLFRHALRQSVHCETEGELAFKLQAANEVECGPPLDFEEVERIAASAWRIETEGRNNVGRGRYIQTPEVRFWQLADKPDALLLDMRMRLEHEGRCSHFCASPKGMAAGNVLPRWTAGRYRTAIRDLLERGIWTVLKKGGRGPGDPYEYGFAQCSVVATKGPELRPYTSSTPRAWARDVEAVA